MCIRDRFNDTDKVPVYDPQNNCADYISAKAHTVIIDKTLLEENQEHRYRFTMGHEAGHEFLHKEYFAYDPDQITLFDLMGEKMCIRDRIRLTVTRGILSGQEADCMSTFRFLSFPMVQIQSIILTAPDGMRKRSMPWGCAGCSAWVWMQPRAG